MVAGTEVMNNVLHSACCHAVVANSNQLKSGTSPRNVKLVGNTIVSRNPSSVGQECFEARGWATNADTFQVLNNLVLCGDDDAYADSETAFYFDAGTSGLSVEHNAFFGVDAQSALGDSNMKLASVDESVVDAEQFNYYPIGTADIVGAGALSADALSDIDCVSRGDPPTVGAYEYVSRDSEPAYFVNADDLSDFSFKEGCAASPAPETLSPTAEPTDARVIDPDTLPPTTARDTTMAPTTIRSALNGTEDSLDLNATDETTASPDCCGRSGAYRCLIALSWLVVVTALIVNM